MTADDQSSRLEMFPQEYANGSRMWLKRTVDALASEIHPILGSIARVTVSDLPSAGDPGEADLQSELYRPATATHEWIASLDTGLTFDRDTFLAQLWDLADSYGRQLASSLLQFIQETAEKSGQAITSPGGDLYEGVIAAAELLEFAFDEEGNHNITVVVHPDTAAKLVAHPPTTEQEARMGEILERKRREWNAARTRRDLP